MIELLRSELCESITGHIKTTTFRVSHKGKNYALPKVSGTWGDPLILSGASAKWGAMAENEKDFWFGISQTHGFWSRWTAFVSSFILSVGIFGLVTTILQPLGFHPSTVRFQRYLSRINSVKRHNKYMDNESDYTRTDEILELYPIELTSPLVLPRMLSECDVNSALETKLVFRTDLITIKRTYGKGAFGTHGYGSDYMRVRQVFDGGYGRKGFGTGAFGTRRRIDDELYEPFIGFGVGKYGTGRFGKRCV